MHQYRLPSWQLRRSRTRTVQEEEACALRRVGVADEDIRAVGTLAHDKEVYWALTLSNIDNWVAESGSTCKMCGKAPTGPLRRLWVRVPGTKWSGREVFDVCWADFALLTGYSIKQASPTAVELKLQWSAAEIHRAGQILAH